MSYVLAIDVGTSFTAAAVARFDHGTSSSPECLPLGIRGTSVPSVLFYPEEGPVLVGEAAERRGLDSPGRVVREFKRRMGDAVPISVGTLSLPAEDVFATMARWVADRAEEREGAPPSEIILTHPAAWGSHRTSLLREALAARSLQNVALVTEPEAAALHYASQVRVEEGSTIAVYDLGGGTFDTAVLRKAGNNRFELLGRPEGIENLGGADFDAAVLRYVAGNTGGILSSLDTSDPGARAALARLQRECVEAKEALSADSEASISVLLPGFHQQVRLVRSEFEALINEPIRDTVDALEQSLASLRLEPADLSAVLLIGGSSRIPLVAQVISEQLDRPIAVDADPKSSICLGAAAAAVLAREAAAAEVAAQAAAAAEAGRAAAARDAAAPGYAPGRLASWSRKSTTAAGAMAGIAAQGAGHGQHGHRGGAHAPKPTVRLTAIAAAAAAFTVLSATAAQSPEGLSSLTSIFTPKADAAPEKGSSLGGSGGGGGVGGAAAAGAGAEAQEPARGIEASASTKDSAPGGAGLDVAASPTSRPTSSAAAEQAAADSGGTGALDTGTGTADSAGTGAGGVTEPVGTPTVPAGTVDPAPGTSEPVPVETGTGSPVPVDPPPTTEEPPATEEPPPVTEEPPPATEEPPPPVTEEPTPPATEEPPPSAPEPTASTATESAPATDPATATEAAPATDPATAAEPAA